jgi:hypothetical protein
MNCGQAKMYSAAARERFMELLHEPFQVKARCGMVIKPWNQVQMGIFQLITVIKGLPFSWFISTLSTDSGCVSLSFDL